MCVFRSEDSQPMLRFIFYVLWIAPLAVLTMVAFLMVRRGLRREYPFFFSYAILQVLTVPVELYVYHYSQQLYFFVYWVFGALSIGVAFGVIHEIFCKVFEPFHTLRDLGNVLFRWAAVILVVVALLTAWSAPVHLNYVSGVFTLERSIRVMQCGLVLLMMFCENLVGLTWRNRIFGIAVGFGTLAATDLVAVALVANYGTHVTFAANLLKMSGYFIATLTWATYVSLPEVARQPVKNLAAGERWNFAMSAALHPQTSASSLPLIMGAVDRAFEKVKRDRPGPLHADQ